MAALDPDHYRIRAERAEASLRDNLRERRLLLDGIGTPVLALRHDFIIHFCNIAYARFVNRPIADIEGHSLLELFPAFEHTGSFAAFRRVLETRQEEEVEGPMGDRIIRARIFPTRWGILSVADDITEQRRAEDALKSAYSDLEWLVEKRTRELTHTNAALHEEIARREQAIARANAFSELGWLLSAAHSPIEAARTLMRTAERFIKWDSCSLDLYYGDTGCIAPVLTMDTLGGIKREVAHAYQHEPPGPLLLNVLHKGALRILRTPDQLAPPTPGADEGLRPFGDLHRPSASLLFVPARAEGEVVGLISLQSYTPDAYTADDLAFTQALADHIGGALARIRATEALRQSEERYRRAIATIDAVVYKLDHPTGRYLHIDPAIERMTGRPAPATARPFWTDITEEVVMRGKDTGRDYQEVRREHTSQQLSATWKADYRIRHADGSERWIADSSITIYGEDGTPLQSLGILQDITERRNLEQKLLHAQKMESIGRLAGGIAHDFNNLLTAILGYAEVAAEEIEAEAPTSLALAHIDRVRQAGQRAAELTAQLLAFARGQVASPRILRINELISTSSNILQRLIGTHIRFCLRLHPDAGSVRVDPGQFLQVLVNLAVNARDAMPDGGDLTIETDCVELTADTLLGDADTRPGPHALLTVTDTGHGMEAATLHRVFDPFFTTKGPGKGTGLGLSTVHGIVRQAGGVIRVASKPGQGATFRIYLPRVADAAPDTASAEPTATPVGTEAILLVDDDDDVRDLARRALTGAGYAVTLARDGVEALGVAAADGSFDLLVTDLMMPRMGGRELATALRALRPDLKVLYTSGFTDDAAVRHAVEKEGQPFLQKPFTAETLARAVHDVLDA